MGVVPSRFPMICLFYDSSCTFGAGFASRSLTISGHCSRGGDNELALVGDYRTGYFDHRGRFGFYWRGSGCGCSFEGSVWNIPGNCDCTVCPGNSWDRCGRVTPVDGPGSLAARRDQQHFMKPPARPSDHDVRRATGCAENGSRPEWMRCLQKDTRRS